MRQHPASAADLASRAKYTKTQALTRNPIIYHDGRRYETPETSAGQRN